ncbi:hypothetical protein EST38_g13305 [Candolleomyces aberdarensis]|uniref:Uncharacterized protein n=1 Tax=Candolleomyces aberdarensis TaxID=2316362 RepID=A0A4Q2D2J8_9AGAR|nr:hypothetical protein EST38_g13305 [Candolleomyces aberdarensis]
MRVYTGVITILIESAAPLTIFGVINAAMILRVGNALSAHPAAIIVCSTLFDGFFYSFCALSPHLIIFRVTTGRSFTKFPSVKDGVLTNPIHFAQGTAETSFLHSTLDRELGRNRDVNTEQGLNGSIEEPTRARASIIHIT